MTSRPNVAAPRGSNPCSGEPSPSRLSTGPTYRIRCDPDVAHTEQPAAGCYPTSWTPRPRVDHLREVPAAVRFLSCEPLIGPLDGLNLDGVHWVIAGGESGANHRRVDGEWVRGIRDECQDAHVAFFFKQWGGRTPKAFGRELDGRRWDEMPAAAAV